MNPIPGILSNNRFLSKINPVFRAALADGGEITGQGDYARLCARQIVDMGHWDNLKLWTDSDLVKTRVSGADLFLPKVYDISGNGNHGVQATEAYQPELDGGMVFDGSGNYLSCGNDSSLQIVNNITVLARIKTDIIMPSGQFRYIVDRYRPATNERLWGMFLTYPAKFGVFLSSNGTGAKKYYTTKYDLNDNEWHLVGYTYSTNNLLLYVDGSVDADTDKLTDSYMEDIYNTSLDVLISAIYSSSGTPTQLFEDLINDIRIYNTVLTATEIAAIYNLTKYRYGL